MRTLLSQARRTLLSTLPPGTRRHAGELGYLGLAVLAVLGLTGAAAGWWYSPWSPAALDRPAARVAAGDTAGAIAGYRALADSWGPDTIRQEAAWRAAQLQATDPGDPIRSVALLRAYLDTWPASDHRARAWARLAGVYSVGLGDQSRAAAAWEQAAWAEPDHPEAGRWLLESGKAYAAVGDTAAAERALGLATEHPDRAAGAWLALARLRLSADPAAAYDAYDMALRAAGGGTGHDGPEANLARLGLATALERLEGREAALAQLDEALSDGRGDAALVRRHRRLRTDR